MALPHRQWLAAQIFSDQATVSYRTLARALKVHVNAAKRMLFDFHAHENAKKPGSVHATYLLAGAKKPTQWAAPVNGQKGAEPEDEPVPSSPPPFSSSMLQSSQQHEEDGQEKLEQTHVQTITLVREESLDAVKSTHQSISSIHIYSLTSHRLPDLQPLSDTNRQLYTTYFAKEDPLEHNATYGVITNKSVRRRTMRRPPPPTVASKPTLTSKPPSSTPAAAAAVAAKSTTASQLPAKQEESSRPSSAGGSATPTSTTGAAKKPTLKRDASDIFKAFAKGKKAAAQKSTPNLSRQGTDSSMDNTSTDEKTRSPAHAEEDDEEEGESEDEALFLDTQTRVPAKRASTGKAEREAKLRKMMDDSSDAEMEDAELIDPEQAGLGTGHQPSKDGQSQHAAAAAAATSATATGGGGGEKGGGGKHRVPAEGGGVVVDWSDSDAEKTDARGKGKPERTADAETEAEAESMGPAQPRRRRGKRRVMKKKTMKDEEGYLVTREMAMWESFSEDEPVVLPVKAKTQISSQKQGKGGGEKDKDNDKAKDKGKQKGVEGGGNIMSFFGKKA